MERLARDANDRPAVVARARERLATPPTADDLADVLVAWVVPPRHAPARPA